MQCIFPNPLIISTSLLFLRQVMSLGVHTIQCNINTIIRESAENFKLPHGMGGIHLQSDHFFGRTRHNGRSQHTS